ncbi:hypothetical protein ACEN9F_22670 [Duganella sp. CT11-25]|uniref:hypothetical protein n=1 Tax=unclassified Duganella TaxID=2636909 RepID=UPI0039B08559
MEKILLSNMPKSIRLAEHIIEFGQNPIDLIAVVQHDTRYAVLEGNRRAAVLKVLNKPILLDSMPDGLGVATFCKRMKKLATQTAGTETNKVTVVLFATREKADVWINLKHTGENGGAGTVPWDASAQARYSNNGDIGLELLDFGKAKNWFSDAELKGPGGSPFPLSTLNRLLGDPDVRSALGLTLSNNVLLATVPAEELAKGVRQVVVDLASGTWNVTKLKLKGDRKKYIAQFPASAKPDNTANVTAWQIDVDTVIQPPPVIAAADPKPRLRVSTRKALIPREFVIRTNPSCPRLGKMYAELRRLEVEKHENAVAVLLRTYIELSLDDYISRTNLTVAMKRPPQATLAEKAKGAAADLKSKGKLDKNQEQNVHRLVGIDSDPKAYAGSITTLHAFVHSMHANPIASELKTAWDNIAPFIKLVAEV